MKRNQEEKKKIGVSYRSKEREFYELPELKKVFNT